MDRSELWNTAGSIDSVYCGSGVDGKGLRCVVFFSGCNLRCPFCHNPETLFKGGEQIRAGELAERLMKYKPYFRRGGVTLSGGEPFLQKKFLLSLVDLLHAQGIHVLAETNGQIADGEILSVLDGVIVDIKNQEGEDLSVHRRFIGKCGRHNISVQATCVLVPGKNDTPAKIAKLARLLKNIPFRFLPFRKLCAEKYKNLGLVFPYAGIEECDENTLKNAENIYKSVVFNK